MRVVRWTLITVGLAAAAGLISFALLGSQMRFSGDDFCDAGWLATHGFGPGLVTSYFDSPPLSGNRYSRSLTISLTGLLPPESAGVWPLLGMAFWSLALWLLVRESSKALDLNLDAVESAAVALFIVLLSLYQAPKLDQILFWRAGMFTYLAPVIANTFLATLLLRSRHFSGPVAIPVVGAAGLALLAGGFSETVAAMQFVGLVAGAAILRCTTKAGKSPRTTWMCLAGAGLATATALALLWLSPANRTSFSIIPGRPTVPTILSLVSACPWSFFRGTVTGHPLPTVVTLAFFAALGWKWAAHRSRSFGLKTAGPLALLALVVGTILVASGCAPSIFVQGTYPELRTLFPARIVTELILASWGWLAGAVATRAGSLLPSRAPGSLMAAGFALLGLYNLRIAVQAVEQYPRYRRWAVAWDARDDQIRSLTRAGGDHIVVEEIDHIISDVVELRADPGFWYNRCAADYYGVKSIVALPP